MYLCDLSTSFDAAAAPFLLSRSLSPCLVLCMCVHVPCLMTLNDYKIVHFEHGRNGRAHSWNVGQDESKQKLYFIKSNFNLATKCPQERENKQREADESDGRWEVGGGGDC